MLILFAPFMLLSVIYNKLDDEKTVFFRSRCITMGGRKFGILKFQNMTVFLFKPVYKLSKRGSI